MKLLAKNSQINELLGDILLKIIPENFIKDYKVEVKLNKIMEKVSSKAEKLIVNQLHPLRCM